MVKADVIAILSVQIEQLFSVKNVSLCYKSNGQCLGNQSAISSSSNSGCTRIVGRTRRQHKICSRRRYLHTLPTNRVHSELDERTLDIVHSLLKKFCSIAALFSSAHPVNGFASRSLKVPLQAWLIWRIFFEQFQLFYTIFFAVPLIRNTEAPKMSTKAFNLNIQSHL